MLSETSQMEKDRNQMISVPCGIESRKQQMSEANKLTDTDNSVLITRGEGSRGRMKRVKGVNYVVTEGD